MTFWIMMKHYDELKPPFLLKLTTKVIDLRIWTIKMILNHYLFRKGTLRDFIFLAALIPLVTIRRGWIWHLQRLFLMIVLLSFLYAILDILYKSDNQQWIGLKAIPFLQRLTQSVWLWICESDLDAAESTRVVLPFVTSTVLSLATIDLNTARELQFLQFNWNAIFQTQKYWRHITIYKKISLAVVPNIVNVDDCQSFKSYFKFRHDE